MLKISAFCLYTEFSSLEKVAHGGTDHVFDNWCCSIFGSIFDFFNGCLIGYSTLCPRSLCHRSLCHLVTMSPGQFVLWSLCPLVDLSPVNLTPRHFVLRSLCPWSFSLVTLSPIFYFCNDMISRLGFFAYGNKQFLSGWNRFTGYVNSFKTNK
jgi:hypothetical protein